jgi:hypothetical protein
LPQNAHEANCWRRGTTLAASFSARTSPAVHVLKLKAEKSNHPVSTATHHKRMIIAPIHTDSQSSLRIRLEIFLFLFIKGKGFSTQLYAVILHKSPHISYLIGY